MTLLFHVLCACAAVLLFPAATPAIAKSAERVWVLAYEMSPASYTPIPRPPGDHLHPGPGGYAAMGDAIDLKLFN